MIPPAAQKRSSTGDVVLFLVLLALGVCLAEYVASDTRRLSREAMIRSGVGEDMLGGATRGRQGFIGSAYWAPLPTLLALPLLKLPPPVGGERALPFVAAAAAALLGVALNAWLRRNGHRAPLRLLVVLTVFLSPPVRLYAAGGGGEILFALFGAASACLLMHWWETEQLRSLSYLALALMLAIVTRYEAIVLLAAALGFVVLHLALRGLRTRRSPAATPPEKSYAEATLVVFLVPAAYAALLWVAANWLLMGDATFFLRGLPVMFGSWHDAIEAVRDECGWGLLLAVGIVTVLSWALRGVGRKRGALWVELPALAASFLLWSAPFAGPATPLEVNTPHGRTFWSAVAAGPVAPQNAASAELGDIVSYLHNEHSGDAILVSGYRGYEVAHEMTDRDKQGLVHVLSFYLDQALRETKGKRTYLLVPEPVGADRWEDINLKYPDLYQREAPFVVLERSWHHWNLFRVVRNDETDRR